MQPHYYTEQASILLIHSVGKLDHVVCTVMHFEKLQYAQKLAYPKI